MKRGQPSVIRLTVTTLTLLILTGAFYQRAAANLRQIDYRNSNFVFFWLAGRMQVSGGNPYDSGQWLAAHDAHNITWRPNRIFPYPLPLAVLLAPLGFLSLENGYLVWQLVSQVLIALSVWWLLGTTRERRYQVFVPPLMLILLFFGPVYLGLQIGALGPFTLAALTALIAAIRAGHPFAAGMLLSLALLKPPQGVPIALLMVLWLVARRDWKSILGLGAGGFALLLVGVLADPHWLPKFATAGQAVMDRTLGVHSNALGLAYHVCSRKVQCMWWLGGAASLGVLAATGYWLIRNGRDLTAWEALGWAIPSAFVSTLYLWSYDQILYLIPMCWILWRLIDRTRSYLWAFGFLIFIVLVSLSALAVQANTGTDLWSLMTTIVLLAAMMALSPRRIVDTIVPAW